MRQDANVCVAAQRASSALALIGDAESDQIGRHFAQQMLRERTRATLREALKFEEVFRYAAHLNLLGQEQVLLTGRLQIQPLSCDQSIGQTNGGANQRRLNRT